MSILSTFWLVFKGDNKDALNKADEVEKANDKTAKAINRTSAASSHATNQLVSMGRSLLGLAVGAFSTAGMVASIKNASDYAIQLDLVSRQLHVNVSDLDMWANAVKRTGGTAQGFESSLQSLAKHFGVTNQTALTLLPTLADAFQKIGTYRSQNYGKMLGLDQSTILLLQQGSREVERVLARQKELGLVTKRDAEISRNFNLALQDTQHAFRAVWYEVFAQVLPVFDKFTDAILLPAAKVFREHANLIVGGLIAIAGAAVIAAFAIGILTLPIVAITAAVALLIALFAIGYDDIKSFFQGHDSLIGDALKQWDKLLDKVKEYFKTFNTSGIGFKDNGYGWGLNASDAYRHLQGIDPIRGVNDETMNRYLKASNGMLSVAGGSNLSPLLSSSVLANQSSANSVNIANININTQATDAEGIGGALGKYIGDQIWHSDSFVDDGSLI